MRALSRNTRRVTALTLAAALVIAVYLNWQYARADITPQTEDDTLMVSAEPVEAEAETAITDALPTEAEAASGVNKNYGEAQLVSVANDSGTRFFEQARLKREKAHDEAMDTLQKSLKSSSLTAEEKKEYAAQMAAGLEDLNAENEIETLVRAKGFADCLCFLQAGRADLTVMTAGEPLTAAQVAQIRDVVMNKSSVTAQNHGGGGKVSTLYLCGYPGGAGAAFLAGRKPYALPGCHSMLISIFFSKQVLKLPPH